jgi:hypothetical protein
MKIIHMQFLTMFLILVSILPSRGQNDPLLRIEMETKSDEANYRVTPCGENGLMLYYRTTIKENEYNFWIFILYNKFMQEAWKEDVPILETLSFRKDVVADDNLYLFFYNEEKRKSEIYNFQVLKIRLKDQRYELFTGLLPDEGSVATFDIFNNTVIIGLNFPEREAGLYAFNMETKEVVVAKEIREQKARLENVYLDTTLNTIQGLFNVHSDKNNYFLQLCTFDTILQETQSLKFYAETGKKFNTGRISTVKGDTRLIFGTYDLTKNGSVDDKDFFIAEASGFFVINYSDEQNIATRYQNFLDLENMTGYLRSREYQQAKKKAEKNEDEETISLGYNLLLHDIIEQDSLFYFVGEGYYEDYHLVTNTYYDFYGRAMPVSYNVFDGYRYFNAFISCYDYQGKKLWDNGMEIFNIISFDLKQRVNVFFSGGETILAYNRDGKISAKIIAGPETIEGVDHFPLETTYVNDKIMSDTKSNMEYWYDNYFVAYGFQTIRNNSLSNSKRTVFYINKVGFE